MRPLSRIVAMAALCALPGCFVESNEPETVVVSGDGLLTVAWTLDGTSDPAECAFQGADAIDVVVQTNSGTVVAEVTEDCEAAVTSVALPPGRSSACGTSNVVTSTALIR